MGKGVKVISADQLHVGSDADQLGEYGRRLLAEGDSWFTFGDGFWALPSNLLFGLQLAGHSVIVNCARPGDTLQHIVDGVNDAHFERLLRQPREARYWDALICSFGGNDLIAAAQVPAVDAKGRAVPPQRRLLLTPTEAAARRDGSQGAERYVSDEGWELLAGYLHTNIATLVQRRDGALSRGRPLFLHTYAIPTVRPSGVIGAPQGWLYPAMVGMGIPEADWKALAELMFQRLRGLLLSVDMRSGTPYALPQVYVFDTAGQPLLPAEAGSTGVSGDWANEIHLTPLGYAALGRAWGQAIDAIMLGSEAARAQGAINR